MPTGASCRTTLDPAVRAAADAVLAAPARLGRTRLVCVDGRAGAGKTTFAGALAARLRGRELEVTLLQLDALYEGWGGLPAMAARLRDELVGPLAAGRSAWLCRWDWERDRWSESLAIDPVDVLVLDGVGCYARDIDAHVSYLVWLEADASERRRRALVRDGAGFATRWDAWATDEDSVLSREATRDRADQVVDTSPRVRDG